jgi:hypothetical protein
VKYIRAAGNPGINFPESQSEISDELAEKWIAAGNDNIRDEPWPGLPIVKAYTIAIAEGLARVVK